MGTRIKRKPRPRLLAAIGAALLACMLLAACGTSDDEGDSGGGSGSSSGDILLGASLPLSGESGAAGAEERRGMDLAVEEINAAGGVDGRNIKLDYQDDEGDPSTGISLIQRFKQNGALAILGTYNSPVALGMAGPIEQAQIPLFTVAISSEIADMKNPYIYQPNISDRDQFRRAAQEISKAGLKKVAVIADSTALGDAGVPIAEEVFPEEGLDITSVERFDIEAVDLSPQVFRAKNGGAEAIFVYTVGPATGNLMRGVQQAGFQGPVWASGAASDPAVPEAGGDAVDGLRYTDFVDPTKPAYIEFAKAFREKYGPGAINNFAASGYDMVYAVAESLENAESIDSEGLVDALNQYSSEDRATGSKGSTYGYTPDNHEALGSSAVVPKVYENGEVVVYKGD